MYKEDLRIVFMGTPDFAVESLRVLHTEGYNIAGVITMPDKPAGRGHKIQFSAVKKYALENKIPLLQPEKLREPLFLDELESLKADLQIVVAFRMLPEVVWNMPRFGTFNLHASLLPQYRGAAPINWAVMNGEPETGVTTFFLDKEIDTGKIALQEKVPIGEKDNAGKIHDELMNIGAKLVRDTVDLVIEDKLQLIGQETLSGDMELKSAPKIFKETCRIDWERPVAEIYNHIRGLSPYPAAWTELFGQEKNPVNVKIYTSEIVVIDDDTKQTGDIITDNKTYLKIKCSNGLLSVKEIQFPGKKMMNITDFLRGFNFEDGAYFK